MADPTFDVVSEVNLPEAAERGRAGPEGGRAALRPQGHRPPASSRRSASSRSPPTRDFALKAVNDILQTKLAKRGVSLKALDYGKVEPAAKGTVRQVVTIQQGIATEKAREIVKAIKDSKLKVQVAIQGEQLRVSGKKKDDLQAVIALLRGADFGIPLQFTNFRG